MTRQKEPPSKLGRGLAALLGEAPAGPGARTQATEAALNTLPVEVLEAGPFQPRQGMAPEALAELAASIRTRGILQPILARPFPERPGTYQIIAGERRWRAAQMAGLHEVPVHVRPLSDGDAMAAALVENLQREDLNAIEEAEGLQRLTGEFGLSHDELAGAIGKSRSHVSNTVRLLQLPHSVCQEVRNGALSAGHARALLGHPEPAKAALAVIAQRLTVRQTEALVQQHLTGSRIAPPAERPRLGDAPTRDPEIVALERTLREKLGLKVQVLFDGRGGSLRIQYDNLVQLDGVLALLNA